MVSPISVLQAVENFRLAKDDRGLYLDQDGESWWTEGYFLTDIVVRDKVMRLLKDHRGNTTWCNRFSFLSIFSCCRYAQEWDFISHFIMGSKRNTAPYSHRF